ncbi:MAG: T9SS type A sorting domain-containing protein [Candidatus Zixiibacteriota bacterium]
MKKKTIVLVVFFITLLFGQSFSQNELPNDTLRIEEVYATPGEQGVRIAVVMRNTINVAAFALRIGFDSTLVTPRYELQGEERFVIAYRTTRTPYELMPNFVGTIPKSGIITFICATDWFTIPLKYIPKGSGPVVEFEFDINPDIQQDTIAPIIFSQHPLYPESYNNFSDPLGDLYIPQLADGRIIVSAGGPGNKLPVFDPLSSPYTIDEGDSLGFTVRVEDPDGDSLTLYAETVLPNHATFPSKSGQTVVIQNFAFKPDFTQGGTNYSITFAARDKNGGISKTTVSITVNDVPQVYDIFTVAGDEGGVPGSRSRPIHISMTNSQEVYGIQFTLGWNDSILIVDSIKPAPSVSHFSIRDNLGDVPGEVRVLLFNLDNQSILPGTGGVVDVFVSVDSLASCGLDVPLVLSEASEAINFPYVESKDLAMVDGSFYVDCFGDVTLDRLINVADIVSLVGYILENVEYDSRKQLTADVNQDMNIDVIDLQGLINIILGRPIGAPGIGFSLPLAVVDLDLESLKKGADNRIFVHSENLVPVAGVQLKLRYDPDQISFSPPVTTDLTNDFIIQYKDEGKGKMTVVMYNMAGKSIQSGEGNILSLPVELKAGSEGDPQVEIEQVIMADPEAVGIPVGKKGTHLPIDFKLAQNYPNPFNPSTTIEFEILSDVRNEVMVHTTLKIYNVLGRKIKTLINEMKTPGVYQVIWDGTDEKGDVASSGVYFYQLKAKDYKKTRKMVLMK